MKKTEKRHLDNIARVGCIVCDSLGYRDTPAQIHHPRAPVGLSERSSHFTAVPLCPDHHWDLHNNRVSFTALYGDEWELLAKTIEKLYVYEIIH